MFADISLFESLQPKEQAISVSVNNGKYFPDDPVEALLTPCEELKEAGVYLAKNQYEDASGRVYDYEDLLDLCWDVAERLVNDYVNNLKQFPEKVAELASICGMEKEKVLERLSDYSCPCLVKHIKSSLIG